MSSPIDNSNIDPNVQAAINSGTVTAGTLHGRKVEELQQAGTEGNEKKNVGKKYLAVVILIASRFIAREVFGLPKKGPADIGFAIVGTVCVIKGLLDLRDGKRREAVSAVIIGLASGTLAAVSYVFPSTPAVVYGAVALGFGVKGAYDWYKGNQQANQAAKEVTAMSRAGGKPATA